MARAYNALGYIYLNIGDYTKTLKSSFESVKYGKLLNNGWESYPLGNIINVYRHLEDYDNAIKYIRISTEIDKKAKSPTREYGLVYSYSYLLIFHQEQKQLDSCKLYIDLLNQNIEVIDTIPRSHYQEIICFAQITMADFYIANNNLNLAKKYINLAKEKNTKYIDDNILHIEGKYYLKKGDFGQLLNKIKEYEALNLQNFKAKERLFNLKIDYYTAINDFKNVAKVQEELLKNQKEKFGDDRLRFSTFANAEYESLEKQQQIEQLENQQRLDILRNRNRNIVVLIVLIAAALWGILLYRSKRQKEVYTKALEIKNEQLKSIDVAKTRFFANVSHELKTPLTLIINPLQKVLKTKKLDSESQFLVQTASKNSLQLFDLVHQILEITKFENNEVAIHNSTIQLKNMVGNYMQILCLWQKAEVLISDCMKILMKFIY
ncbi:MAG: hypothetical protein HC803_04265 [Saprospiraceae bacterium]|nr:hypothetical protein [Saprospiraceae bacterium]